MICVVWRKRGKLPVAIDSTAQLIKLIVLDKRDSSNTFNDQESYRSMYALSIIRSINGIIDQLQEQYFVNSIYNIGNKIDIPGQFH